MKAGVLIILCIFLVFFSSAQKPGIYAGIEAGFNFNTPVYQYDTSFRSGESVSGINVSLCGGPYLLYRFSNKFAIKTAAWYFGETLQKTNVYDPDVSPPYGRHTVQYYSACFKVPVLLRFTIKKNYPYYLDIGPCLNLTFDRSLMYIKNPQNEDSLAESRLSTGTSFGLCMGFGGSKKLQQGTFLTWEALYSINNSPPNTIGGIHGDFCLLIGLAFQFSKRTDCHTF
jgi:hypothetical protein